MPQIDNKNIIQIIPNMEIGGAEKTVLKRIHIKYLQILRNLKIYF